jgi:hypothetical protein
MIFNIKDALQYCLLLFLLFVGLVGIIADFWWSIPQDALFKEGVYPSIGLWDTCYGGNCIDNVNLKKGKKQLDTVRGLVCTGTILIIIGYFIGITWQNYLISGSMEIIGATLVFIGLFVWRYNFLEEIDIVKGDISSHGVCFYMMLGLSIVGLILGCIHMVVYFRYRSQKFTENLDA